MSNSRSIENPIEFECFCNNLPVLNDPLDSIGDPFQMSEISRRKCKEVIATLENGIKDRGEKFAHVLVNVSKMPKHSDCKRGFAGVQALDFWKINQHLDQHLYKETADFINDVRMMLKDVVDNSVIASEVIEEVDAIHDLFLDLMERTFENLDFSKLKVRLSLQVTLTQDHLVLKSSRRD